MEVKMKVEMCNCSVCGEYTEVATGEATAGQEKAECSVCAACAQEIVCWLGGRVEVPRYIENREGKLVAGAQLWGSDNCEIVVRRLNTIAVAKCDLYFSGDPERAAQAARLLDAAGFPARKIVFT